MRFTITVVLFLLAVQAASAAGPLFPSPLHLTRQVHDPFTKTTMVLEEFGYGDRLVSVRGARTSIADYQRGELTEIDREAGTYSITRFDLLAKAAGSSRLPVTTASTEKAKPLRILGARATKLGHAAEFFSLDVDSASGKTTIEIGVDATIKVSREALEVLVGAAYPGARNSENEAALSAAAPHRSSAGSQAVAQEVEGSSAYALPVEQVVRYDVGGQQLEFRTSVVRIGNEAPSADLLSIPAGARLVLSRSVAVNRALEQIEHPTQPAATKNY